MQFIIKNLIELQRFCKKSKSNEGFTLLEILIVLVLVGIMAAMSGPYISFGINPLKDTTNRVAGIFKLMRVKAMSQTSAYRISQTSATQLIVESSSSCLSTTWTVDPSFTQEDLSLTEAKDIQGLAKNKVIQIVAVTNSSTPGTPLTSWTLCYDSRGIAGNNLIFTLKDIQTTQQKRIEIFSGGAVQTYEN